MIWFGVFYGALHLALLGVLAIVRDVLHEEPWETFGLSLRAGRWRSFLGGIVVGGIAGVLALSGAALAGELHWMADGGAWDTTLANVAALAFAHVSVALFEEALFRGYLQPKLVRRWSPRLGIAVSSLIFGLIHLPSYRHGVHVWLGVVNAGALGACLGYVAWRTGHLAWPIGFHWAWNTLFVVLELRQRWDVPMTFGIQVQPGAWAGAPGIAESGLGVSLAVVAMGLGVFLFFRRGKNPGVPPHRHPSEP